MAGSALNAFAPCGAMRLSSRVTYGEMFYRQLVAAEQVNGADGAFDTNWNTYNSCRLYTIAMCMQTVQLQLDHAFNQRDPRYVTEKLEELEKDYQLVPSPTDTLAQRRLALAYAMALKDGNLATAISAGLQSIIGAEFSSVRALTLAESSAVLIGQTTLKTFDRFGTDYKLIRTTSNISAIGTQTVSFTKLGGGDLPIAAGDKLAFDVNCNGRTEVVTVTAATSSTLTAVFAHGHDSGAIATTQQWPAWVNPKRHLLVYVSSPILDNAALLTKANNFLDYALRGSSTWIFIPGESQFIIGTSRIGQNTIGAMIE